MLLYIKSLKFTLGSILFKDPITPKFYPLTITFYGDIILVTKGAHQFPLSLMRNEDGFFRKCPFFLFLKNFNKFPGVSFGVFR